MRRTTHAMLVGQGIGQGNGHNRPCTPMTMRTIPQEGIEDLRGRFEWLCKAFHVQEEVRGARCAPNKRPPRKGEPGPDEDLDD